MSRRCCGTSTNGPHDPHCIALAGADADMVDPLPTTPALRVVGSKAQADAIEILEGVLAAVREHGAVQTLAVAVQYGTRVSTKYVGAGAPLLGLAARLTHDINRHIDDDND